MDDKSREEIAFESSTGNVFADLGLPDADSLLMKAEIGFQVFQLLERRGLSLKEIGHLLGLKRGRVSNLVNGHFHQFTTDELLDFLRLLDHKVTIRISPHSPGEPYRQVVVAIPGR